MYVEVMQKSAQHPLVQGERRGSYVSRDPSIEPGHFPKWHSYERRHAVTATGAKLSGWLFGPSGCNPSIEPSRLSLPAWGKCPGCDRFRQP